MSRLTLTPVELAPQRDRGRPRLASPLDQKITLTVTATERAIVAVELGQIPGGESIADLVRHKTLSSIDIVEWRKAAVLALEALAKEAREKEFLRKKIARINRELRAAQKKDAPREQIVNLESQRARFQQEYAKLGSNREKRDMKIVGRFSFEDREDINWRANQLGITLSDYARMMVFDLKPGEADAHMSFATRKRFYQSVIKVADKGWGKRPSARVCRNCQAPLPTRHLAV